MRTKLLQQIFTACMIVLVMSMLCISSMLYDYLSERTIEGIKERTTAIAVALETGDEEFGLTYLESLADSATRITLIAGDGTVLYDSYTEADTLENHASREEFLEALLDGEGLSERYSSTLLEKTVNYAKQLDSGEVLRLSVTLDSMLLLKLEMLYPIFITALLTIILSVLLAFWLSQSIMKPINCIDLENPDDREIYDEMKPFIRRIVKQNQQIYAQMQALKAEHKKQDDLRREFTANVSHELKTPLTSISGFAELLKGGLVEESDIPRFADYIYQEAGRLTVLVNDIMELSKLEDTPQQSLARERVDLTELCQGIRERMIPAATRRSVTITVNERGDGASMTVYGVRKILEEIVANLVDNAIKYNYKGGYVHMEIARTQGDEPRVYLEVSDSGIGIPEDDLPRICERFYRVNKSHSKEVGGTGLGLSIVKHGLALHKAELEIESEEGKGTLMRILF